MIWRDNTFPVFVNNIVNFSNVKQYFEFEIFGINSFASKFTYYMFSLLKKFTISFGDLNIFHWLIISAVIWTLIHGIYLKCIKLLLERVRVAREDQKHLSETIWHLCFTAISVPLILSCVGGSVDTFSLTGGWVDRLDYHLSKCKVHEDVTVPGVRTVFVLHCSVSAHDLVNTWYCKGFRNFEFFQKQLFLVIFILTYYSKCPLLGLSVLFLVHRCTVVELLSKLCCLLAHFTRSVPLGYLAKFLCGCFLVLWSGTFLYTLPAFLSLSKTIDSHMIKAELKTLIVMDFLFWVYLITSVFNSMFSRVMLSVALPHEGRPRNLEYFLFGCDPWLLKLTSQEQESKRPSVEELLNDDCDENRRSSSAQALIQTVRCSILLKRKLRRMREKKATQIAEDSNGQSGSIDSQVNQ